MAINPDDTGGTIGVRCSCGKQLRVSRQHLGLRLKCRSCGAVVITSTNEEIGSAPPDGAADTRLLDQTGERVIEAECVFHPNSPSSRPFWKDPIVVIGGSFPAAILIAFFIYLHVERSREHVGREIIRVKAQGDAYLSKNDISRAYERYDTLLKWVGASVPSDGRGRAALEIVRQTHERLKPEALELQRKKNEEAKQEALAEEQARKEQAELASMAQITVTLKGDAWLTRKLGTSEIIRGLPIFLIKQKLARNQLSKAMKTLELLPRAALAATKATGPSSDEKAPIMQEKETALFQKIVSRLEELASKGEDDLIDSRELYAISRLPFAGEGYIRGKSVDNFRAITELDSWTTAVAEIPHLEGHSNVDGKYRFEGVEGGRYYAYAAFRSAFSFVEWMIPVELNAPEKTLDLYNANATLILNESQE